MLMLTLRAFALIAAVVPLALAAQSRDVSRPLSGTSSLSGSIVTDEGTPRPVRRATVTIFIADDPRSYRSTASDDAGRFTFEGLPAGHFTLTAAKPGHVTSYYGAKRPGSTVGTPLAIAQGERRADVTLRLVRGSVITGTVLNEAGRPMPSVTVRAQRVTISSNGDRTISPPTGPGATTGGDVTDDRGVYRIFGLSPGDYLVTAQPRFGPVGLGALPTELRETTTAELQWAERQASGGPATAGAPAATQAAPPVPGRPVAYATVFHPGTFDIGAAAVLTMAPAQERSGVDLRVAFVATARVEGRVSDGNGQPAAGVMVTVVSKTSSGVENALYFMDVGLMSGSNARTGPDGSFSIPGIQPGQYSVVARPIAGRGEPTPASAGLWATIEIDVDGRDITGLALTLLPGMTVSGRMTFAGAAPPADARVTIRLVAAQPNGVSAANTAAVNAPAAAFAINGVVPGSYRVAVTWGTGPGASPWLLKSAVVNGRDVADVTFEVKPSENVSDLVLTFAGALAELSGVLYDTASRPTSDLSIIVFPTDRALWHRGARRLRAPVRPASDGRFTFTALPAGDYYLAALADFEPLDWFNPQFLEQVAPGAIKITIGDGEKRVQDLRVGSGLASCFLETPVSIRARLTTGVSKKQEARPDPKPCD
jgi:hypothetical protein